MPPPRRKQIDSLPKDELAAHSGILSDIELAGLLMHFSGMPQDLAWRCVRYVRYGDVGDEIWDELLLLRVTYVHGD